jgi:hypothetical protein
MTNPDLEYTPAPVSLAISLGRHRDFAVTLDNRLIVQQTNGGKQTNHIDLGPFTKGHVDMLLKNLERVRIHALNE